MLKSKFLIIIIILLLTVFFILEVSFLFILPKVFYSKHLDSKIANFLDSKTNLDVNIKNLKIRPYPDFSILFFGDKLILEDKEVDGKISLEEFSLKFSLIPLIYKRLNIQEFKSSNLEILISRNRVGNFSFANFKLGDSNGIKPSFNKMIFALNNYSLLFDDYLLNKKITFIGDKFLINKLVLNKFIDLEFKGALFSDNVKSDLSFNIQSPLSKLKKEDIKNIDINGSINNLDLSYFAAYLNFYKNIKLVKGNLHSFIINTTSKNNIKSISSDISISDLNIITDKNINFMQINELAKLSIKSDIKDKDIVIKDVQYKAINQDINLRGVINNFLSNPKLDLVVNIKDSKIEDILKIIPVQFGKYYVEEIEKTKKYGLYGDIKGKLNIKNNYRKPDIYGEVEGKNVYVKKPFKNVPNANIIVKFLGKQINIFAKVYSSKDQWVNINGQGNLYNTKNSKYVITSTPKVDLSRAMFTLIPVRDVIQFSLGPLPYMELSGIGNISLDVEGSKKKAKLNGKFNFYDTKARYKGINLLLEDGSGVIDFDNYDINFKTYKAKAFNKNVSIYGKASTIGDIDFISEIKDIDIKYLMELLKTSPLLKEQLEYVKQIDSISGITDFKLNLKGKVNIIDSSDFVNDLIPSISFNLKDVTCKLKLINTSLKKIKGSFKFENNKNLNINISGLLGDSLLFIKNNSDINKGNIIIQSKYFKLNDALSLLDDEIDIFPKNKLNIKSFNFLKDTFDLYINYKGKLDEFNFNNVIAKITFQQNGLKNSKKINIYDGVINIKNNNVYLDNIKINFYNSIAKIEGSILKISDKKPRINIKLNCNDFNLNILNDFKDLECMLGQFKKIFSVYENFSGLASINANYKEDKLNADIKLKNAHCNHNKLKFPVDLESGTISVNKDKVYLASFVGQLDNTPFFLDAQVDNIFYNPKVKGYTTLKISDSLLDSRFNSIFVYPIKVKGDVNLQANFEIENDSLKIKPLIKLNQGSDVSYKGSNFGDEQNLREIYSDIFLKDNLVKINNLKYTKYIASQNKILNPIDVFTLNGKIIKQPDNKVFLDSIKIATQSPVNVRLLNIIFKKSILKEGNFNCNLVLNGDILKPKVKGVFRLNNANMPIYNSVLNDLDLDFQDQEISLKANGLILDSSIKVNTKISNSFIEPIILSDLDVEIDKLNLDNTIDFISKLQPKKVSTTLISSFNDSQSKIDYEINSLLIKNAKIKSRDIILNDTLANNFIAKMDLDKQGVLNINELSFDVVQGKVKGEASYDFNTTEIIAKLKAEGVDSTQCAKALFDIENQIYGKVNGKINFKTKGETEEIRLKNLSGDVEFEIKDGKLPKLGSLEYLLKAGNVIKSGITGLTANSIIDLLVPINSGSFNSISGKFRLNNGIADNIEILSHGLCLNLYLKGNYNLIDSYAKMEVFGQLLPGATSILGPIGNASINSFFLTIPKINIKESEIFLEDLEKIPNVDYSNNKGNRFFNVKINGDINGNKYVKSFEWIER